MLARNLARLVATRAAAGSQTASPARSKPSWIRLFGVVIVALILAAAVLLLPNPAWSSHAGCSGVQVYPGDNLRRVAAAHPEGTTYCIHDGYYSVANPIHAEDHDVFRGLYRDTTRPGIKTDKASHIIYTKGADNVTVRGLRVSGAVHYDSCEPDCGRGIGGGGNDLTIINVRATKNENQGIGGTGDGLRVFSSELDHNGSVDAADDGGKVSAAGLKAVNSIYVENSYVHDNYWDGVWCDIECGSFEVHDSTLVNNGKAGIHDEISTGPAVFEGNTIEGNGYIDDSTRRGGILIVGSSNAEVYGNTFRNNGVYKRAVEVANDSRTLPVSGISIHDNTLNGEQLKGCDLSGVSC